MSSCAGQAGAAKERQVDLVHEQVPDELLRGAGRGSTGDGTLPKEGGGQHKQGCLAGLPSGTNQIGAGRDGRHKESLHRAGKDGGILNLAP